MNLERASGKTLITVALITIVPSTISAIGAWQAKEAKDIATEAKAEIVSTAVKVKAIQHQTNSMNAAMVASAKLEGERAGKKKGVAQGTAIEKNRVAEVARNRAAGAEIEKAKPWYRK